MLTKLVFIGKYCFTRLKNWSLLIQMEYSILGVCFFTILPLYCKMFNQEESYFMSSAWFIGIIIFGVFCFIIDGIWIRGYLLYKVTITNKIFDGTKIIIEFGDIFEKNGLTVISVNEYFDNAVSSKPHAQVADKTLHGMMINKYWKNNPETWYSQIIESIDKNPLMDNIVRTPPSKSRQFPIGSTGIAISGEKQFLCVALSHTNISTFEAKADFDDLMIAIKESLIRARSACSNEPLNFPLLGSSLSRTGINKHMLLNLLLMSIFEESKKGLITSTIRIVLNYSDFSYYNLAAIKKEWS